MENMHHELSGHDHYKSHVMKKRLEADEVAAIWNIATQNKILKEEMNKEIIVACGQIQFHLSDLQQLSDILKITKICKVTGPATEL